MNTKQRTIILEELQNLSTHPTADELFQRVRLKLPNISLGTVYRNLNQLAEQGVITKFGKTGEQKRFDARQDNHYHFTCSECGKIYDLIPDKMHSLTALMNSIAQHEVHGFDLEFYGKCANCKNKEKNDD